MIGGLTGSAGCTSMKRGSSETRCSHCGYDLSGTRRAGLEHCPECGWTLEGERKRLDQTRRRLDRADLVLTIVAAVVVIVVIVVSLAGRG